MGQDDEYPTDDLGDQYAASIEKRTVAAYPNPGLRAKIETETGLRQHTAPEVPWVTKYDPPYPGALLPAVLDFDPIVGAADFVADVRDFMIMAEQEVHDRPIIPTAETVRLRMRLIQEEIETELLPALANLESTLPAVYAGDLADIVDGIADSIYVLVGTAHALGLPLARVWDLVHAANMAKGVQQEDGTYGLIRREDGKILKPDGWVAPDAAIRELIRGMTP